MVAALPAASLNPATPGRGPRPRSGAMANCPNAGQAAPAATSSMAIAYCPPDTKFWFIWSGRTIRVQYGQDRPVVVELPAPVPMPRRPPFAPGVAAFVDACDAWLKDDIQILKRWVDRC